MGGRRRLAVVTTAVLALLASAGGASAAPAVAAPTGVTARTVSMTEVDVSWSAVAGATSYRVLRGAAKGGPYSLLASPTSTTTTYRDAKLTAGTTAYYVVQAEKKRSLSANSAEVSATTLPAQPTELRAVLASPAPSATTDRIDVSWSPSTGATGYDVLRRAGGQAAYTVVHSTTATKWSDASLAAGTYYTYAVRARNGGGTSTDATAQGVVTRFVTTTSLLSTANPANEGESVTFVATVRGDGANAGPGGSVDFHVGVGTAPSRVALDADGVARYTTSTLPGGGDHQVTATYVGDAYYRGSNAAVSQRVRLATVTTLTSSRNPVTSREPVTLTATVKNGERGVPGFVDFAGNGKLIATAELVGGVGVVEVSDLPEGTSHLVAHYRGGTYFAASTSPVLSQVVKATSGPYTVVNTPGLSPTSTSIADVNGDGRQDVLVAGTADGGDYGQGDWLVMYPQDSDGTLQAPTPIATSAPSVTPQRVASGDVDADGYADVVHASANGLSAYFGKATSSAHPGTEGFTLEHSSVTYTPTVDVVVADVDGDPAREVVAAHADSGVWIYQLAAAREVGNAQQVTAAMHDLVAAGDVTGDGRVDVVGHQPGSLTVYARSADGSFAEATSVTFPGLTSAFTLLDANSDGKLDIVATGQQASGKPAVFVVPQLANGVLGDPYPHASTDSPGPVVAADVTGDKMQDVITAHAGIGRVSVYPQLSHYDSLDAPVVVAVPAAEAYDARGLAAGDTNGDGETDVVLADPTNGLVLLPTAAR